MLLILLFLAFAKETDSTYFRDSTSSCVIATPPTADIVHREYDKSKPQPITRVTVGKVNPTIVTNLSAVPSSVKRQKAQKASSGSINKKSPLPGRTYPKK